MVAATKRDGETIPIDVLAKTNQWMIHVDQLLKVDLKQLPLWLLRFTLGAHRFFPVIAMFSTTSEIIISAKYTLCH
jgi:hypothetical protein